MTTKYSLNVSEPQLGCIICIPPSSCEQNPFADLGTVLTFAHLHAASRFLSHGPQKSYQRRLWSDPSSSRLDTFL